jgi:hypothetical protein
MGHLELTEWISLFALVVALPSAVIGVCSYRLARKSYFLAEVVSKSAQPQGAVYLIDAFRWRDEASVLYVFCVSVENKSTIANSIVDVELRLPYRRGGKERMAVLAVNNTPSQNANMRISNTAQIPAVVPARGAVTAAFCFRLATELIDGAEFDEHVLRFKFADGPSCELRQRIIMGMTNVQELEKKRRIGIPV